MPQKQPPARTMLCFPGLLGAGISTAASGKGVWATAIAAVKKARPRKRITNSSTYMFAPAGWKLLFPLRVLAGADQVCQDAKRTRHPGRQLAVQRKRIININPLAVVRKQQAARL